MPKADAPVIPAGAPARPPQLVTTASYGGGSGIRSRSRLITESAGRRWCGRPAQGQKVQLPGADVTSVRGPAPTGSRYVTDTSTGVAPSFLAMWVWPPPWSTNVDPALNTCGVQFGSSPS